ncbi:unnamed protein product [Miscanthus lutarioriparius]|uniref:TF-B3 domain-containing protein n=1 Tax=Miscanthus lutarioriparius TaxID=422564 RepID=A0A811QL83_9POAL|nr:unnamed protein product [Miscanthus lutarioriparius]
MANAKGSSAGAAGHGDLGRAISHEQHYQAFMASVRPGAANVHQHQHFHQYPAGLIPAPVAMPPVHVPVSSQTPYSAQMIVVPPPQPLIPPPDHRMHSLPPTGCYQDYSPYGNTATMNMLQTPSFHSNHHVKESGAGFSNSFNMAPSVPPTSPFQLMSPSSTNYTSTQIFEETNNLKDTSRVFGGWDNVCNNSEEPDPTPAVEMEDLNQGNGHINVTNKIANCQDYQMVLRKDLTNSDVGNIGIIVLPKKDAERNLPILEYNDGLILEMDDFELPAVWKFKYRYWTNNNSRMYILETRGELFVKRHGLQARDILIIYRKSGRYVARAVKAEDIPAPECECIKSGIPREECGFSFSPLIRKRS